MTDWYNIAAVKSYADCEKEWAKVRFPNKGKPLGKSGNWRMFKAGNSFAVNYGGVRVATISPENILTYTYKWSIPPVAVHRYLPLIAWRVRTGTYASATAKATEVAWSKIKQRSHWRYSQLHTWSRGQPELFDGAQFDLTTGAFLNPKPALKDRVVKGVATEWKRDLSKWMTGLKARARIGLFDTPPTGGRGVPSPMLQKGGAAKLVAAIRANEHPAELMEYLRWVTHSRRYFSSSYVPEPAGDKAVNIMRTMINSYRVELRKIYGVYND